MPFIGNSRLYAVMLAAIIISSDKDKTEHVLSFMEAEAGYLLHEEPGTAAIVLDACRQAREMLGFVA
ncbi:hypothetical protein [Castellaniella sp.]|uniref:hypothetical protein n=1 Tax=Castellaniella sp. TaxID=1955812 RepID=UPI002AFF59DD|nr:hypothetical protein [Castellaniella sp.]